MISCSVCEHSNDDLDTICSSCGSFLQDRIPNLDFFATVWDLVEYPKETFRRIVRAEHKNYVLFLMFFLGVAAAFTLLWARHAGNAFDNLIHLILLGSALGLVMAYPVGLGLVLVVHWAMRLLGGKGVVRNTYAVLGWSLMPIMLSVAVVLPIEFASIGLLLFSTNPSPMEVKPVVYLVLLAIDAFAILWSVNLAGVGLSIAHKISPLRSFEAVFTVSAAFSVALYRLFSSFVL